MELHITPNRIANSIQQDNSFSGAHLLLEGRKDIQLFSKLVDKKNCKITQTHGKHNMREVYQILSDRSNIVKVGIRDADFLRIKGNDSYDSAYNDDIYPTDLHDIEGMVFDSESFYDFLDIVDTGNRLDNFESDHGEVKDLIYKLAYPIGCLRLANKLHNLGLCFKPRNTDGPKFRYNKIICQKNFSFQGEETLINTLMNYSRSRTPSLANYQTILTKLQGIIQIGHPEGEIVNGHDIVELVYIICKKGLRSSSHSLLNSSCVFDLFSLAYSKNEFSKSQLHSKLDAWQQSNRVQILKP